MEIILAKEAGFCYGVKRALDLCMKNHDAGISFATYGELIHNKQVVSQLETLGIKPVSALSEVKNQSILIRSHGVPKTLYQEAKALEIDVFDGTCPYVRKIQKLAETFSAEGYAILIVGDATHPEVIGISGWSSGIVYILNNTADAHQLPNLEKACIVAQTTITAAKWEEVLEVVKTKITELVVNNTICEATRVRQQSAEELSQEVDLMLVIGGKHSSNSKKLFEVCQKYCKKTYHIETLDEIEMINFSNCDKIGITAGASTPDSIINEIINALKNMH